MENIIIEKTSKEKSGKKISLNKLSVYITIWKQDINSLGKAVGLSNDAILGIRYVIGRLFDKTKTKDFTDVAKLSEADDEQQQELDKDEQESDDTAQQSISLFNRLYKKIILEEKRKYLVFEDDDDPDDDSDVTGDLYTLTVKDGRFLIKTKDGKIASNLTDQTLSQLIKKIQNDSDKFKPGKLIKIQSAEDSALDQSKIVKKLFKQSNIAELKIEGLKFPELSDQEFNDSDYTPVQDQIKSKISDDRFQKVFTKIAEDQSLLKMLTIKNADKFKNFIYAGMCAAVFVQGIRHLSIHNKKEVKDKNPQKNEQWKNACMQFQKNFPAEELENLCFSITDANPKRNRISMQDQNIYDYTGKPIPVEFKDNKTFNGTKIHWAHLNVYPKARKNWPAIAVKAGLDKGTPQHPQSIRRFLSNLLKNIKQASLWSISDAGIGKVTTFLDENIQKATQIINKYPNFSLNKLLDAKGKKEEAQLVESQKW